MTRVFWMWLQAFVGESFLIDIVTLRECNHQTLSKAGIQAVTHADIALEDIVAFVTDSTAYCKKKKKKKKKNS